MVRLMENKNIKIVYNFLFLCLCSCLCLNLKEGDCEYVGYASDIAGYDRSTSEISNAPLVMKRNEQPAV